MGDSVVPRKQERDFTSEVDALLSSIEGSSQLTESLDKLAALEKQTRNAADLASTSRLLVAAVSLPHKQGQHAVATEQLTAYSKKHGQLRQAVVDMVEHSMVWLKDGSLPEGSAEKLALIETLREVTEGKIYLEVQRARVTRMLATIKEHATASPDIKAASDLLQDLQVETFGSMDRTEKTEFILEQMRLLRVLEDWDKLAITSKKINVKWLSAPEKKAEEDKTKAPNGVASSDEADSKKEADKKIHSETSAKPAAPETVAATTEATPPPSLANQKLKLQYYHLMIAYALQASLYLDLSNYYKAIYETPVVQEDQAQWMAALRNVVFFAVLAPYDNEQADLLARISKDDNLSKISDCHNLVKCFSTPELMRWPGIEELYGPSLRSTRVFGSNGTKQLDAGDITDENESAKDAKGDKRWEELHLRVVEHNIRTIAKYYTRIQLSRLGELLDLPQARTEEILSRLTVEKMVYAKIDRPAGAVSFQQPLRGDAVLNEWSSDVGKLMGLVEKTCHLIAKEHAIANASKSTAKA